MRTRSHCKIVFFLLPFLFTPNFCPASFAAEDLKLRPGISFSQDLDNGFPILADKLDDVTVEPGRPSLLFFGASGDLNTNRQAKRIVELYRKNKGSGMKFIIVDVDHATQVAKSLVEKYYHGYIPSEVVLDKDGRKSWSQIGEIDNRLLQVQIEKVL
jgi:hypothetical protein